MPTHGFVFDLFFNQKIIHLNYLILKVSFLNDYFY